MLSDNEFIVEQFLYFLHVKPLCLSLAALSGPNNNAPFDHDRNDHLVGGVGESDSRNQCTARQT